MGRTLIAMNLNERGIPSPLGMKWHPGEIYVILTNEKYVGDLLMQKYYVQDYLTKKMVRNQMCIRDRLNAIPNAPSGSAYVTLETLNAGGVSLGTRIYGFTITAPASVVPTFTSVTALSLIHI